MCEDAGDGEKAYCCIGVLNEVVLGTEWHTGDVESPVYVDDDGESELIAVERVANLDLDTPLTLHELDYFADNEVLLGTGCDRLVALAYLNDEGWSFSNIVDVIRELGWNNVN